MSPASAPKGTAMLAASSREHRQRGPARERPGARPEMQGFDSRDFQRSGNEVLQRRNQPLPLWGGSYSARGLEPTPCGKRRSYSGFQPVHILVPPPGRQAGPLHPKESPCST